MEKGRVTTKPGHSHGRCSLLTVDDTIYTVGEDMLIVQYKGDEVEIINFGESLRCIARLDDHLIIGGKNVYKAPLSNLEDKQVIFTLQDGKINTIDVYAEYIAISTTNQLIFLDVEGQQEENRILSIGAKSSCFTNDATKLAVIEEGGTIAIYEVQTMQKIFSVELGIRREEEIIRMGTFMHYFALPGETTLRILNTKNNVVLRYDLSIESPITSVSWHPCGRYIAVSSLDKRCTVLDLKTEIAFNSGKQKHRPGDLAWREDKINFMTSTGKLGSWVELKIDVTTEMESLPFKHAKIDEIPVAAEPEEQAQAAAVVDPSGGYFDKYIGITPQEPLQLPASNGQSRILYWNKTGRIIAKDSYVSQQDEIVQISTLEIDFADRSFHRNLFFNNEVGYIMAAMSPQGAIFASKGAEDQEDSEDEDFVVGKSEQKPQVLFKNFHAQIGLADEWSLTLSENPEAVAVGDDWCVVFTSALNLRFFTNIGGIQLFVCTWTGPIVSLASSNQFLSIISHSAAPVLQSQKLSCEIWDVHALNKATGQDEFRHLSFDISLSPEEHLVWSGFSAAQDFYTWDSAGILRLYWRSVWVPVAEIGDFQILSITANEILGVDEVDVSSLVSSKEFKLPLCRTTRSKPQTDILAKRILTEENHEDLLDRDKLLINEIREAALKDENSVAVGYFDMLSFPRTKAVAIQMINSFKKSMLAQTLHNRMQGPQPRSLESLSVNVTPDRATQAGTPSKTEEVAAAADPAMNDQTVKKRKIN